MLQEPADKFLGGQGAQFAPLLPGGGVAKGHLPLDHLYNPIVADGHPKDVGGQILQRRLPITHRLRMHHPGLPPDRRRHLVAQLAPPQGCPEFGPKQLPQGADVHQKARPRGPPPLAISG